MQLFLTDIYIYIFITIKMFTRKTTAIKIMMTGRLLWSVTNVSCFCTSGELYVALYCRPEYLCRATVLHHNAVMSLF